MELSGCSDVFCPTRVSRLGESVLAGEAVTFSLETAAVTQKPGFSPRTRGTSWSGGSGESVSLSRVHNLSTKPAVRRPQEQLSQS